MNIKYLKALLAGIILSVSGVFSFANAAVVLDQSNISSGGVNFNGGDSALTWQQEVTAGINGQLTNIDVYYGGSGLVNFFINLGNGWQSDGNDFSLLNMAVSTGLNNIDVSSALINVTAGQSFIIGLQGTGTTFSPSIKGSGVNNYGNGAVYLNGSIYQAGEYDINFQTYVMTSQVAEPVPLALFALGLLGFALRRSRKQ